MNACRRVFAIIPAAGHSRRMGAAKLLLPWASSTIMDAVLASWCASDVTRVVVVLRRADRELAELCAKWPVEIVLPHEDPVDMKASLQWGLRHVDRHFLPNSADAWMVAPADLPQLATQLINRVMQAAGDRQSAVVPRFGARRGHPVLLPWCFATDVFQLAADAGLNSLLSGDHIQYVEFPPEERPLDVDTPADYERIRSHDQAGGF